MLENGTLRSCPFLTKITLDKALKQMKGDSACGCPSLQTVEIWATSTLNKDAFKSNGQFFKDGTAGNALTPLGSAFTIKVLSDDVMMGLNGTMWFPFNIREYDEKDTTSMPVRVGNTTDTDSSMVEYFKISSPQNYYKFSQDKPENLIKDSKYYEKITNEEDKYHAVNDLQKVAGFKIEGIKLTPANGIKLFVVNKFKLSQGNTTQEVDFDAEFTVKVLEVQYYPVLYTDNNLYVLNKDVTMTELDGGSKIGIGETTINLCKDNANGDQRIYYNLENVLNSTWLPEMKDMNVIVESSDANVMEVGGSGGKYPKKNADGNGDDKSYYEIEAPANAADIAAIVRGKSINLIPKSTGDATVSIYVSGYPQNKITWNFHIFSDVQGNGIKLSIPKEQNDKKGFKPGDTFNILESLNFYKKNSMKRDTEKAEEKLDLATMSSYSKAKVSFSSDNPAVASIDDKGNVKIISIPKGGLDVTFEAKAQNPEGDPIVAGLKITVKYPNLDSNTVVDFPSAGGELKVDKSPDSKTGEGGTLRFDSVKEGTTVVNIPDAVTENGSTLQVTSVKDGIFKENKTVQTVTLGANITKLNNEMFKDSTALTTVVIKGNVEEIPNGTFSGCTALTSVTLPATVKKIGANAFAGCKKLKTVTIPAEVEEIGEGAFKDDVVLNKVVIPKKVKSIPKDCFSGCKKLKTVTYQKGSILEKIEDNAFSGCKVLPKMTIVSKRLTAIGGNAFNGCKKLKNLVIKSKKLTSVGNDAFKGIAKKCKIKVPKKQLKAYKEIMANKGQGAKVKISK